MRMLVLLLVVVAGGASVAWSQSVAQSAPQPPAIDPANFTGKVTPHLTTDIRMTRYTFDAGARSNWHSHEGGQVLVIEKGRMRAQERGGPSKEFGPRETYVVAAGTTHWHGAIPGEPLTQVALSYGVTTWMERVTDAQYAGGTR
jgi:quercetin dioxygenase-like cupin family protein